MPRQPGTRETQCNGRIHHGTFKRIVRRRRTTPPSSYGSARTTTPAADAPRQRRADTFRRAHGGRACAGGMEPARNAADECRWPWDGRRQPRRFRRRTWRPRRRSRRSARRASWRSRRRPASRLSDCITKRRTGVPMIHREYHRRAGTAFIVVPLEYVRTIRCEVVRCLVRDGS